MSIPYTKTFRGFHESLSGKFKSERKWANTSFYNPNKQKNIISLPVSCAFLLLKREEIFGFTCPVLSFFQGILTEGKRSVQLTSLN